MEKNKTLDRERKINEKKFGKWDTFPDGGRKYWMEIRGKSGWSARYIKEVDKNENTIKFYQEIYNGQGELVEIHCKFPKDTGHKRIR